MCHHLVQHTLLLKAIGFAGAILARKLAKQGRSAIVIESRERLGGRTNTIRLWVVALAELAYTDDTQWGPRY